MNTKFGRLAVISSLLAAGAVQAAVLKVPQQYATIQAAVTAAQEGDTVRVAPGTYTEHLLIQGKAINLLGAGWSESIIDGGGDGRVVTIAATGDGLVTISGFTLRNGFTNWDNIYQLGVGQGGGVYAEYSNLALRNSILTGNRGCLGLALTTLEVTLTMTHNRIEGNVAEEACGQQAIFVRANRGAESLINSNVIQNHFVTGLQLQGAGKMTIGNNIFRNNLANGGFEPFLEAGGLLSDSTDLTLVNNLFSGNASYNVGGAQLVMSQDTTVRMSGNSFVGNSGVVGPSSLELAAYGAASFVVQSNRFDESGERPVVHCDTGILIDRSNVFATDPEIAATGDCERGQ
jgi:hypothetical protein